MLGDLGHFLARRDELEDAPVNLPVAELLGLVRVMPQVRDVQPVGEVAWVASVAEEADRRGDGPPIAGIVGHADLTLGDAVEPVIEALDEAGRGRFRGVRDNTAWDATPLGNNAARAGMLAAPRRRRSPSW